MKRILFFLFLPLLLLIVLPASVQAATFRSGDSVRVDTTLEDLYASGGTVTIAAPTRNDLTVAGGTVTVNGPVTGGLLGAGGTINIRGVIGNSARVAGGTITLSAPIRRDAVLFGGTITLDDTASVSGDLIANGGTINIQAPVTGDIEVNGGQVTINAPVGGNVRGKMDTLILGNNAVINGNLSYTADRRAVLRDGAVLKGQENFRQREEHSDSGRKIAGILTTWSLYKLIADMLGSLALIYLLYRFTTRVVARGQEEPLKNGVLGLAVLILTPIIGFFLLILIFPGILTFLLYAAALFLAAFLSKILLGYFLLRWWYGRDRIQYRLDWKAAIVGPLAMFLLFLIPIIGWLIGFILFLIALGSLASEAATWLSSPGRERIRPARADKEVETHERDLAPATASRPARTVSRATSSATRRTARKKR